MKKLLHKWIYQRLSKMVEVEQESLRMVEIILVEINFIIFLPKAEPFQVITPLLVVQLRIV